MGRDLPRGRHLPQPLAKVPKTKHRTLEQLQDDLNISGDHLTKELA